MKTLLLLKGLPACGKTTYATKLLADNPGLWKRVNKDELRTMLDAGLHSGKHEGFILAIRDQIILQALREGYNIVVDDTNLNPIHEARMRELAADFPAYHVEVKHINVHVLDCIERDKLRGPKSVGQKVIWEMYEKYLKPPYSPPQRDGGKKNCYIFDVDGTLAHRTGRDPYDYSRVHEDYIDESVCDILLMLQTTAEVIIVSGRDLDCAAETVNWLNYHNIHPKALFMRPTGDKRPDHIVKRELYEQLIAPTYNVLGVFDDRDQVVRMWRDLGLKCYQVDYGNF